MKKIIFLSFFVFLFSGVSVHAATQTVFLKPDISLQMKRQEEIDKKNFVSAKKQTIKNRLADLRRQKLEKSLAEKTLALAAKQRSQRNTTTTQPQSQSTPGAPSQIFVSSNPVQNIDSVDMPRVRSEWLSWYNMTRSSLGIAPYTYDSRLDNTAHDWNIQFAAGRGQNHHKRSSTDSYYDYPVIDAWFSVRGINPKVVSGSKHTENVGYGYYRCTDSDCTDELIASIRSTYDFFMAEKGKTYDAHYKSIINPSFTKIGLDVIVVPSENRYYLTVHYITE